LRRYFEHHGALGEFDWGSLKVRNINPLHVAWLGLDEEMRLRMIDDFRNFALLGTPAGKLAIIDEAAFHPGAEGVAAKLSELEDFYACAFWAYFERTNLWNGAVFFAAADGKPRRYWRKRINLPRLGRKPTDADAKALGIAIGRLFTELEGRGGHCEVHPYRRGEREYFFAYPQDHRQTSHEYDEKGLWTKRPYNPAFEIIFVHDDGQQTLNTWHRGVADRVKDLQVAFSRSVLGAEIPRDSLKDTRVYELGEFMSPTFVLTPSPELGILNAEVRKLRLQVLGNNKHTIRIELGAECPAHVLYDRIEAATRGIARSMLRVSQVGINVTFELRKEEKKHRARSFEITWPNSCSLQNEGYDVVIQRMLAENKIEPRLPTRDESDDDQGQ
jgi:hypothetical protein